MKIKNLANQGNFFNNNPLYRNHINMQNFTHLPTLFKIENSHLNKNKEEFFYIKRIFLEIRFSNNSKKRISFGEKRLGAGGGGGVGWVGKITGTSGY
jgi:hypothetical protein